MSKQTIILSDEQQIFIKHALAGENILVDACIGSGKTTAIQELCNLLPGNLNILYLTYNRLLKVDAKHKIKNSNVTVTNYHGFAGMMLMRVGVFVSPAEMIQEFLKKQPPIPKYDVVVFDEYQDIDQEISELLEYISASNPLLQKIAVGDMDQKIYDKTRLQARIFIEKYLGKHTKLKFTKCFRLSEDIAAMLGRIWNKDIIGVNNNCSVEYMTLREAATFLSKQKPKDILCLGTRTGDMARVLNYLEDKCPDNFNKKTVYASIKNQDANIEPKKTNAIFTTYDSCKGMERRYCIVFDFDEANWALRIGKPQQSYEILRNIFCVAASRGKEKIIFVQSRKEIGPPSKEHFLSEETLKTNPGHHIIFQDVNMSEMFDHKYRDDIQKCYSMLEIERVEMEDKTIIDIQDNDFNIDLSPCIGIYQEATYFDNYNIDKSLDLFFALHPEIYYNCESNDLDGKILYLTAQETAQKRYVSQVKVPFVSEDERDAIHKRLATKFSHNEMSQIKCSIPFHDNEGRLLFSALGLIDVYKDHTIYELKFVNELQHVHFLQCASYMLAMNIEHGVLWNVKKNEYFKIRIKNRNEFYEQVALTITKHEIAIAHYADDIKKKVSVNAGLMGYSPKLIEEANKKHNIINIQQQTSDKFAVIDVETNFDDDTISIGVAIAKKSNFKLLDAKYYIVYPAADVWGMYTSVLYQKHKYSTCELEREETIKDLVSFLGQYNIGDIYAYSATFDYRHLPELQSYNWYDIVKIAAYKQHNPYLSNKLEYCSTGRLKTKYGVEDMMKILTASRTYKETHHALFDAIDELKIMELLGLDISTYDIGKIS